MGESQDRMSGDMWIGIGTAAYVGFCLGALVHWFHLGRPLKAANLKYGVHLYPPTIEVIFQHQFKPRNLTKKRVKSRLNCIGLNLLFGLVQSLKLSKVVQVPIEV